MSTAQRLTAVLVRDLRALKRELEAYPTDADVWRAVPGIPNTGGNLALHLAGNIQHFIGTVLGGTDYKRDRDAEFKSRDVPRAELIRQADAAIEAVSATLPRVDPKVLEQEYSLPIAGHRVTTGDFLFHLATHFTYHLGQLDYHRRVVTGSNQGVGAVSPAELSSARKV